MFQHGKQNGGHQVTSHQSHHVTSIHVLDWSNIYGGFGGLVWSVNQFNISASVTELMETGLRELSAVRSCFHRVYSNTAEVDQSSGVRIFIDCSYVCVIINYFFSDWVDGNWSSEITCFHHVYTNNAEVDQCSERESCPQLWKEVYIGIYIQTCNR